MATKKKRATVYFQPEIFRVLRVKSAETEYSISDLVNDAVARSLREDAIDLEAFEERRNEPLVSFETVVRKLKKDGRI
jgi:hypothetical protein